MHNEKQKLIIFASGTKDRGGSGFENLVNKLGANVVAVVSNHKNGGVRKRADSLDVPFVYFPSPWTEDKYKEIVGKYNADWVALSGWLKHVKGLDPERTFNIHPALLSALNGRFGGKGMYGHKVHEEVFNALESGEITESGVTMHFVNDEYDRGPTFFEYRVNLKKGMSAETIGNLVNAAEHEWQPHITNMVINGEISWDGKNPSTLKVPDGYQFLPG